MHFLEELSSIVTFVADNFSVMFLIFVIEIKHYSLNLVNGPLSCEWFSFFPQTQFEIFDTELQQLDQTLQQW